MTVSMRPMSAGNGYRYLLKNVAAGDGQRSMATPLTRYYAEAGCPPGRWLGSGLASLAVINGAGSTIAAGDVVSEVGLQRLIGQGLHPLTGEALGRCYRKFRSVQQRIDARVAALDPGLTEDDREAAVAAITATEQQRGGARAVAGYDYTFSVPKSVSVLWALADAGNQELIVAAHHTAVERVVGFMEREVVATRIGARAQGGPALQVDVSGVIATAFDHWDSRAGDPQLHTHVVISNKVHTVQDGKWRAIDGRPMHAATVAVSELYNAVLADEMARVFGLGWDTRDRGRNRNPAWEIEAVPEALIGEFSARSADIEAEKDRMIAEYTAKHRRGPSDATVIKLRQQATLATRPAKAMRSLAELTTEWRDRGNVVLGEDATAWAGRVIKQASTLVIRADDVPLDVVANLGASVLAVVGDKRSTWTRWNLHAEASRQTMSWRFATAAEREAVTGMIVDAAEAASLRLTPEALSVPVELTREDGPSRFRPRHHTLFTSQRLFDAEEALLALGHNNAAPRLNGNVIAQFEAAESGFTESQVEALEAVATSGRIVDVLVGPAGAGKTTALAALRQAWEQEHGAGSVVGLAPSATAAAVLAEDLGIATENTAKWLTNHDQHGETFSAGQLVLVDEASLAGTFTLHRIATLAADAGAKVLLVGDYAQLQAVEAGGAFAMLVADRTNEGGRAAELVEVHRFRNDWEKAASLDLRHGRTNALDAYETQGRITGGESQAMIEAAYSAWRQDLASGRSTLLIADIRQTVRELNQRARDEWILTGHVELDKQVRLRDGLAASRGDWVITRKNDRHLIAGRTGWVRNGDRWQVTGVFDDGSVTVRRAGMHTGGVVTLPAAYAREHLDLGYAVTAHRAQGVTVDTAHTVVTATTTRENLYVAMTRGRETNRVYVATSAADAHAVPHPDDVIEPSAREVLCGVLANVGSEASVHEARHAEVEHWGSITQLGAEYQTLADAALHDRWATIIRRSLPANQAETALASEAFGPLAAQMHRAALSGWNVETEFPRLAAARALDDAADPAAVLQRRLTRYLDTRLNGGAARGEYLLGMYPTVEAGQAVAHSPAMATALAERHTALEARAQELLTRAQAERQPWLANLGPRPADPQAAAQWARGARAVAAYRERYAITSTAPFGTRAELQAASVVQRRDAGRIQEMTNQTQPPLPLGAPRIDHAFSPEAPALSL